MLWEVDMRMVSGGEVFQCKSDVSPHYGQSAIAYRSLQHFFASDFKLSLDQ